MYRSGRNKAYNGLEIKSIKKKFSSYIIEATNENNKR